jgi:hypothetical protein
LVFALAGWSLWLSSLPRETALRRDLGELAELNSFLLADVRSLKTRTEEPESARTDEPDDRDALIEELRGENQSLHTQLTQLHESYQKQMEDLLASEGGAPGAARARPSVHLGTLAVAQDAPASGEALSAVPAPLTREGRIVSVDDKDEFVVINLGKNEGVDIGTQFLAKRETNDLARLHVIEVRDTIAACDIEYLLPGGKLRIDDKVYLTRG